MTDLPVPAADLQRDADAVTDTGVSLQRVPSGAELAVIQARADAATPGPWVIDTKCIYPWRVVANDDGLTLVCETYTDPAWPAANAAFIASARSDVPRLVEAVRVLQGQLAQALLARAEFADKNERLRNHLAHLTDRRRADAGVVTE